ncbi:MAG: multiple sugar transport system substrate-binding protein [Actinomycetota bacterium]|jgi:ABC-type glycerol-3-phosphate transport system substrate-binding protein|nr:multiple sugar transport system substrate-binding protein [Actinomycetota bacterium]
MFATQHGGRRTVLTVAALSISALLLTSCSSSGGTTTGANPDAKPKTADGPYGKFPGEKLTLSRWAGDPWTAGQQTAATAWNASTGGNLTLAPVPYENLHDKQALTLSSGSDYDIVYVHPSWFGEFAKAGYLAPIDKYLSDPKRNPPGFSAASYQESVLKQGNYDGTQYCLPDFVSTIVVGYRTDLFQAAGLSAPKTVDDIIADAKALNGKDGASGIVMPGKATGAVSDVFSSLLTAQDNWWYDASGTKSTLDTTAATNALNFYTSAAKYAPTGLLNMAVDDAATVAAQGKAAIVVDTTPSLSALEDTSKSKTVGKWAYVPLAFTADKPGGELIYWNWCISAKSKNKDAAYSFLQFYTDTAQQAKVALAASTLGATKSFYTDKAVTSKLPFLPAVNAALSNSNPQPSLATWPKIQTAIEVAVQDAIQGKKTTAQAVAAMQDALKGLTG